MARCIVVLADGLRPDAITRRFTPALREISRDYTRAANAVTVRPSVTVAALTSLATGVSPATHGLVEPGLGFLTRLGGLRPLGRELARERIPTLVAAGSPAARSRPITWALGACAGVSRLVSSSGSAGDVVRAALPELVRHDGFAFVYLPDCDRAGHASGWMSPPYLRAAAEVDAAVELLAEQTGILGDGLLVVLADHGGGGVAPTDHDAPHPLNDAIPLMLAGPDVRRCHVITEPVSLLDVPATVLDWFDVPVPACYEGVPLRDAFAQLPLDVAEAAIA
ncbi:MAG: alkaline phosphatase family protein [Gemmatimonadales bacterium]